jgi:hypothetical protein
MRPALAVALAVGGMVGWPAVAQPLDARPPPSPQQEATRLGGEYFVQRAGAAWTYQVSGQARVRWAIHSFVDWRAAFSWSLGGKRSGTGTWRVKEGASWRAPASIEHGPGGTSSYEVVALDAVVELPTGERLTHCLAVLETGPKGERLTHYFAPNLGKVGVEASGGWLSRLVAFSSGARHSHEP